MQEILRSNDEKLQKANADIARLEHQTDSLKRTIQSRSLPESQIQEELQAQYPAIHAIKLATSNDGTIILVIYPTKRNAITNKQLITIEEWIKVRLNTNDAIVIQK